ncbi:MAG: helix-turn-helix domain-containing protein [Endozoicomonas sp.]
MSSPSQWPLTFDAVRQITPEFMLDHLRQNPLTRACYSTASGYYPRAYGHHIRREKHDDNLLIYCIDGTGIINTRHYSGTVGKGDLLLLPAGLAHSYQASKRQPWSIYWVHFDGLHAGQLLSELEYRPEQPVTSLGLSPVLTSDFKRLLSLRQSGYQHSVFNYAAALIRQILHFLALEIRSSNTTNRHNFNLDALHSLMLENLHGDIDLDTLAASVNLSRHHFASKYKQLTGTPPIRHFIHLKMERACYLLDTSPTSIKEVAGQLGFKDPLYFSRQFRQVMGLSPSEYRLRQRG